MRVFLFTTLVLILSLAISSGYDFGTKVMANDTDMGEPLFDFPGGWTVGFWDTAGTPGYDQTDPVYLHQACHRNNMIADNDVRLTSIGNHCPGSKVKFEDIDMNKPLNLLPATINYLNLYGSSAYDLDDPVYLHQYYCGTYDIDTMQEHSDESSYRQSDEKADPLKIEDFEMRLPYRGRISVPGVSCIKFSDGYQLLVSDIIIDFAPSRISMLPKLKAEVIHGVKVNYYHILGTWLMKIAPAEEDDHRSSNEANRDHDGTFAPMTAFICTNDIRLSRIGNLSPGTKIVDFDPDQNKILAAPAMARFLERTGDAARIRYVDKNGNGEYDYPDDVYLNYPSGRTGDSVVVNNVRLTLVNASPGS